jgi:ABC-type multidrug transport system ATPase subunit
MTGMPDDTTPSPETPVARPTGGVRMGVVLREVKRAIAQLSPSGGPEPVPSDETLAQAWTFCRLLVRVTSMPRPRDEDGSLHLRERLQTIYALSDRVCLAICRTLFSLEHAPLDDDPHYQAMSRRFPQNHAAKTLQPDTDGDLASFATRPATERLALATAAVAILAHQGAPTTAYLALFTALAHVGVDDATTLRLIQSIDARCQTGFHIAFPKSVHELTTADVDRAGATYTIGASLTTTVCIPDPTLPEVFAELVREREVVRLSVTKEFGRQLYTNGGAAQAMPLEQARHVEVGRWTLAFSDTGVLLRLAQPVGGLQVRNLGLTIPAASGQGTVTLLNDISFSAFTGEVVALVGPSGCGKTTLLTTLAGVVTATAGKALLDGEDLATLLETDRSVAGIVPQDDIVHPALSVEESLTYSARLRLGPEVPRDRLDQRVEKVLRELTIDHIRGSEIGDALKRGISGGQRKRVNFGQELITESTRLLFLDEPTSGLDPIASQSIMRLARYLADHGRVVFVVTHDLSPQIMALVDRLVVLAPGGQLQFYGTAKDACEQYQAPTVDAVFGKLEDKNVPQPTKWRTSSQARDTLLEEWGAHKEASPLAMRSPAPVEADDEDRPAPLAAATPSLRASWNQFVTLVSRYTRVKTRDTTGLVVLAAQPPFLAAVMVTVFPAPTMQMLFMLSLSCAWFGMSGSVRELIADRVIWRRERRVGVGVGPYVSSKLAVLATIVTLQCSFLTLTTWFTHDLSAHGFGALPLAAVATLTGLTGMTLGLLMSAIFSSSEAAVGTLPLLLIPQITFSSLLVGLRDMTTLARHLSWLDPQRYAFDAILRVGEYVREVSRAGEWQLRAVSHVRHTLGFKPAKGNAEDALQVYAQALPGVYGEEGLSLTTLCLALVGLSVLFCAATFHRVATRKD